MNIMATDKLRSSKWFMGKVRVIRLYRGGEHIATYEVRNE